MSEGIGVTLAAIYALFLVGLMAAWFAVLPTIGLLWALGWIR